MPSIGSILSIARTAMTAQQAGVQTAAHNIANAATPGFSRQRVDLTPAYPVILPEGVFGSGVTLADISRTRDTLLDRAFRDASSESSGQGRRLELLTQVEGLFMEPSEYGLSASLDAFFDAWHDLANNPSTDAGRAVLRENANRLVTHFHRLNASLAQIGDSAVTRLLQDVDSLNRLTAEVARLNTRILATESGGGTASDLRDARDRAIDQIATLVPAEVMQRSDGSIGISSQGALLVDGAHSATLEARAPGGQWVLTTEHGVRLGLNSGAIGATITVLNEDLRRVNTDIDGLAMAIMEGVNALHRQGTSQLNGPGIDFFSGSGAGSFALADEVAADFRAIAAGTGGVDADGNPVHRSGAGDIAQRIAALRDDRGAHAAGRTFAELYTGTVSRVGVSVRAAIDEHAAHDALAQQADMRRTSVSGVSIDEELIDLIRFQNAYAAAARVVSAADEMLQTVLGMKR